MISVPPDYFWSNDRINRDEGKYSIVAEAVTIDSGLTVEMDSFASLDEARPVLAGAESNENQRDFTEPQEWTAKEESKFNRLAERKALAKLTLKENVDLEILAAIRRQLKNPRTGEEIIAEYEQRMITRNLVKVLAEYVTWHKNHASNRSR